MEICPRCSNSLKTGSSFCENCGYILNTGKNKSDEDLENDLVTSHLSSIIFGFVLFFISAILLDFILVLVLQHIYNSVVYPLITSTTFQNQLNSDNLTVLINAENKLKIAHFYIYLTSIIFAFLELVVYEFIFRKIQINKSFLLKTFYFIAPTIHFIGLLLVPHFISLNSNLSYFLKVFIGMSLIIGFCVHVELRFVVVYFSKNDYEYANDLFDPVERLKNYWYSFRGK